ncbi:MAG: MerR family transcriptional regulator [Firmicutes bacterium]|nr:MerR family transcriptional regulator [Bacillota bacterium]
MSSRTLRRWDAQGVIKTIRSSGGRRMFSSESIHHLAGERSGGNRHPRQISCRPRDAGAQYGIAILRTPAVG